MVCTCLLESWCALVGLCHGMHLLACVSWCALVGLWCTYTLVYHGVYLNCVMVLACVMMCVCVMVYLLNYMPHPPMAFDPQSGGLIPHSYPWVIIVGWG